MLNVRDIDHVVLRVKDIEAMQRFYCDVLVAVDGPLGTSPIRKVTPSNSRALPTEGTRHRRAVQRNVVR